MTPSLARASVSSNVVSTDPSRLPGRHRSVYKAPRRGLFGRRGTRSKPFTSRGGGPRGYGRSGRRWPKRTAFGLLFLVVALILFSAASYFYVNNELGGIHRVPVSALTPLQSGQPEDVLLVGSDSRACETTAAAKAAFGSATTVTGQRSDTLEIARFLPGGRVEMLAIPRDLYVPIAGTGGSSRINSAFNDGPNPLVETIQKDLSIPINHVVMINFCGVTAMVNSLGGVSMDFRYPVRDAYSGLDVTHTGCQTVNGSEALALVRSRHLYYFANGQWNYDGMSDFSRIKRQQAFFHALLAGVRSVIPNIFTLFSFVGATAGAIATDSGFSSNDMLGLAWDYHSLSSSKLYSSTLPTSPTVIDGSDVLLPVPQDKTVISDFKAGDIGAFVAALAPISRGSDVGLMSDVINPNDLQEPWNPTPC